MNKELIEENVRAAVRPAEGNVHTMVQALSNVLPFGWNWSANNPNGTLNITSTEVDIQIQGKGCVFNWKN